MKVNIACCGIFHYTKYLKYIEKYNILNIFFYSHKLNTNSTLLSIPEKKLVNVWIKEYLIFSHIKLLKNRFGANIFPIYHDIWELFVLMSWSKCDILHVMLHGNCRKLIQRAKIENSIVIGEPVNSHPEYYYQLLQEEYDFLKIKKNLKIPKQYIRLIEEVNMCDYILSPSNFVKKSFIQQGFDKKKSYTIPWGVDLGNFNKSKYLSKSNDSIFRVICVAQISPRKGQIYLLEAWKQLNLNNSELLLIGKVDSEMRNIIYKYENIFRHISSVPHIELRSYYNSSSVFVLPSIEDGFAYVCTEAMACGLPVITTPNTGASELIEHGKEGFIVPIRSPDAIAKYLKLLYDRQDLCQEMSSAASQKSKADFSWENYARKLYNLYLKIM